MAIDSLAASNHKGDDRDQRAAAIRIREDRVIFRALRIIESRATEAGELIDDPRTAAHLFRLSLAGELREHFEVAFLNTRARLIARERLFSGSIDAAVIVPRIVVQRALFLNAAAVLCAHNHPSGDPEPSRADYHLTDTLREALALVGVTLADHFVIGSRQVVSIVGKRL